MGPLDLIPIALYALVALTLGALVARRGAGEDDYLLGGRRLPAVAVLASLVATELSAATYIGVPQNAYGALAWTYLQLGIGSILARLVLGAWVIPLYHRHGVRTVYEYIGIRFGEPARVATAVTFLVGRLLASSVRLFIAGTAFAVVTEIPLAWAIIGCGTIAALYSVGGGIRAVIWTDAFQGCVLLVGAGAILVACAGEASGGARALIDFARDSAAWRPFDLAVPEGLGGWLASSGFIVSAIAGGFFLTLATHATDHDMVQRLLTTRTGRGGGITLAVSGFANVPVVLLFLAIGTALAALHGLEGTLVAGEVPDDLVATFVRERMHAPWRGVVIAGLFAAAMSSLDSAICAIGATWSVDLARGGARSSERGDTIESGRRVGADRWRNAIVAAILVLGALGYSLYQEEHAEEGISLVEVALSAMAIVYGALLGVFGVGFLSRRGNARTATVGLVVGSLVGAFFFLQQSLLGKVLVAWTWRIPIAALIAAAVVLVGPPAPRSPRDDDRSKEARDALGG